MKKRAFEKLITLSIEKGKKEKAIYDNGLDLINFMDDYNSINNILLNSIYGEETSNLINDFITDSIYDDLNKNKSNFLIYKDDEIIADCSTLDGLYKYIEEVRLELISSNYSYDVKEPISVEDKLKFLEELIKM
jgi:hypothetical protein